MGKKLDVLELIGLKFGRLTIVSSCDQKVHGRRAVHCQCSCGNKFIATINALKKSNTRSCGCLRLDEPNHLTHSLRKHGLYSVWANMKQRCYNPKVPKYADYGGRGIDICDNWRNSFIEFYNWSMSNGWQKGLEIDRVNNNKGYSPDNCRFVTRAVNVSNMRTSKILTYENKTMSMKDWAIYLNIGYRTLQQRLHKCNMPLEKALSSKAYRIKK